MPFSCHVLYAQLMRVRCGLRWNYADRTRIPPRLLACDIYAGAVAIVKHCFGNAVAVSIEELPYVRQTIPIGSNIAGAG